MIVRDRGIIAKSYLKGWFTVDFLTVMPAGLLDVAADLTARAGGTEDAFESSLFKAFRTVRLAKMLRCVQ